MGSKAQFPYRIIPPLWICNSIELGYRGDVSFELLG